MKDKPQLPMWQVVAAISAVLIVVILGFRFTGTPGEASKEELTQLRSNQRKFSANAPPPPTTDTSQRW